MTAQTVQVCHLKYGGKKFRAIRSFLSAVLLAGVFSVTSSLTAFAQFTPSMGQVMTNTVASSKDLPNFMAALAYLFGLFLVVMGIIKLKDHVINPQNTPLSDSVKRFVAGGGFFALPTVIAATVNTLAGGSFCAGLGLCATGWAGFNTTAVAGSGLDAMMVNFMTDIWRPMMLLIPAFCYLAGIALIIIGISRLLKTAQEGPRGPGGAGTIMTFLVGGALLSVDVMMGAFSNSLFPLNLGNLQTYGVLTFSTTGMAATDVARITTVISAILAFMMIIGWISFVRGFFILRDLAEGNNQASLMAGMTHLFGGAMAVNLGPVLNAVQSTFGLVGMGVSFS